MTMRQNSFLTTNSHVFDDEFPRFRQHGSNNDENNEPDLQPPIGKEQNIIKIEDIETEINDLIDNELNDPELNDPEEEEIQFEEQHENIQFKNQHETQIISPKYTRSGATYSHVVKGWNYTSSKLAEENQANRSGNKNQKNQKKRNDILTHTTKETHSLNKLKESRSKELNKLNARINHVKKVSRINLKEAIHNLQFQQIGNQKHCDYTNEEAVLIARCMIQIKEKFQTEKGFQFIQQYYLNKGLKIFGDRGKTGVDKELRQLLQRQCFRPEYIKNLSQKQLARAQEAMMLLSEKEFSKEVKGRLVFRGDGTREWLSREDTASPTASLEGIELTITIDSYEQRDIMSMDVPNAFIQTFMPEPKVEDGEEQIVMKITGTLVNILTDMDPEMRKYVVIENGKRVIYTIVLRAIYGMLQSSLLWYNQFRGDLEKKKVYLQ